MKDTCCYILWSDQLQRFYTGACQSNLTERIEKHNSAYYSGNNYTKKASDWRLFLRIQAIDFSHAVRIERKVKSMKSSTYIRNLNKYPELVEELKEKCRG